MNDRFPPDQNRAGSFSTTTHGHESEARTSQQEGESPASEAVAELMENLHQGVRDLRLFFQTQWDGIKLSIRRVAMLTGLCLMAALTAAAALVVAVAMLCHALADVIGQSLGGRPWLGELIVSVVVILGIGLGIKGFWSHFHRTRLRRAVEKYDDKSNPL